MLILLNKVINLADKKKISLDNEFIGCDTFDCSLSLWDDHFSADILLHHDSSSIKEKHLKHDKEMMDAKENFTCEEPEEISSPKLKDSMALSSSAWLYDDDDDAFHTSDLAVRFR
ncbi:hypothetical protein Bca101_084099 [Brassica carinata]